MIAPLRFFASLALGAATVPAMAADTPSSILPVPLNPVVGAEHRQCASKTASGLGYSVLRAGSGAKPGATDLALLSYIGFLADGGQVFDQNPQAVLPVDGVVPGFGEGLQLMPTGSVYRFCIPAALGYGAEGAGSIPPGASLVFQVELLDHKTKAEIEALRKAQGAPAAP